MSNTNYFILTGNLAADPVLEVNAADPGKTRATFTLAYGSSRKKDDGTYEDKVTFFNFLTVFGKRAEYFAAHAKKGTQVFVTGHLDTYPQKQADGKEYHVLCLKVDNCELGYNRIQTQNAAQPQQAAPAPATYAQPQVNPFAQPQQVAPTQMPYAPQPQANPFAQPQQATPAPQANPFAFDPNAFDPGYLPFN